MWNSVLGVVGILLAPVTIWAIVKAVREPKRFLWWISVAVVGILVELVIFGSWVQV